MKRKTAMALAAVFAMSVAGTALAAPANPFVDVPAKHWAYDSINKLAQAGVISGYGDGTYQGDKTLTRYEVATIVAKAMANSDKADAATQKEIDALKAEFGTELNNLGVRVDNLEKNTSKVKFTGEVRVRYDNQDEKAIDWIDMDRTREWTRFRLNMEAPIDQNVTFHGRYESETNWGSGSDADSKLTHAYIDGKVGEVGYSFGRQPVWLGQGLIADIDSNNDGLFLSGGNKVKVAVGAFKKEGELCYFGTDYDMNFVAANIDAQINKNLNMTASYLADKDDDLYKTTSVGLKYTGIKDFTVTGEYGENDSDLANLANGDKAKAWMAQLKYRGAQSNKVGSMGVWVGYRSAEFGFDPGELTTLESGRYEDFTYGILDNVKGAEFGVEYTVFKNGVLTVQYNDLEYKDNLGGINNNKESFFTHLTYTF
ncbi:Outer membrane protein alpha precursor [Sporomusa ovata DSM 2662]|uniref:S-layer domain protein domain protein n=1 Tax=Sporomusa ovata TaxID=2378 RepID=A0A0U1KT46_9FIRM|nr:S-layer homology domain-containing protein [Sporomusa ovata]EQB26481.1 S-layer domain-containing protein [Sporomusa ovata DSM 2662]CQR70567.1 S-layer domain protein domain protein [Sporomusa ovata]